MVQCSDVSNFRAPTASNKRSVVARSAEMPFSSCPMDRCPFVDRGSLSISLSLRFCRHSEIAFQAIHILPWIEDGSLHQSTLTGDLDLCLFFQRMVGKAPHTVGLPWISVETDLGMAYRGDLSRSGAQKGVCFVIIGTRRGDEPRRR